MAMAMGMQTLACDLPSVFGVAELGLPLPFVKEGL